LCGRWRSKRIGATRANIVYCFFSSQNAIFIRFMLTFFVFSPFPLVANLYRAHRQYYGDDEEQEPANDTRRDGLMFHPGRYGEFDFFAVFETLQGVRDHSEVIGTTSHQTFYWKENNSVVLISENFLRRNGSISLYTTRVNWYFNIICFHTFWKKY